MSMRRALWVVCVLGCTSPPATELDGNTLVDSGSDAPATDAGSDAGSDAGPPLEWPELAIGVTVDTTDPTRIGADAMPPNLSCLGNWDFPAPGAVHSQQIGVFGDGRPTYPLAGACVHGYGDDTVVASTGCAATDPIVDASGNFTMDLRGTAPFAVRIFPFDAAVAGDSTLATLIVDAPLTVGFFIPAFTRAGIAGIASIYHHDVAAGRALVNGFVEDCDGRPLYGARVRVAHADGTYVDPGDAPTDPLAGYTDGVGLLSATQQWTHVQGAAGWVNIPVSGGGESVFVEVWGRPGGETEARVVGCATAWIEPDTVTNVASLRPLRMSGPACPGLR